MRCPHCQFDNAPSAKFCSECGAALTSPTAAASPAQPPSLEQQFASLEQTLPSTLRQYLFPQAHGENRFLTILFTDMSGSVKTTAHLHPEDATDLVNGVLKAMVDAVLKYGGHINRFLGDGMVAFFGIPQARENDPERAILAALEIREAVQKLGLNVAAGINAGEVYVGTVGSEHHQEFTAMGPVVNLAARLQGKAQAGQVLVGEAVYRQTRRAFEFAPLSVEVKGLAQPVTAYEVVVPSLSERRILPRPEKVRGIEGLRAELIGRDAELAQLKECVEGVAQGRGQMVSLIGEAGVGKSRLVSELKQHATRNTQRATLIPPPSSLIPLWLEGRCSELDVTASYHPFIDVFRQYFACRPKDSDEAQGTCVISSLRELVSQGHLSEEDFQEMVPLMGQLLSVQLGSEWDGRLSDASPEQIKQRTFRAAQNFFVALCQRQPVVIVLDDLHWADSLSLDLIALLMETVAVSPLVLLCLYRPEREHKCWRLGTIASRKCPERYTEVHLRTLSPPQSRRLVESLLGIENLPHSVKEKIAEKSGGNPFYVEEIIRLLIESGMVYQEGAVWRAREDIENFPVPESIQSVILSRLDRLERDLKSVLESAAVIGRLFSRRLLEYTLQEEAELERALRELEEYAFIHRERRGSEEEYSFKHVLIQETIYQNILRRRRTVFHQKIAEAMEVFYRDSLDEYCEELAYHYDRSGADEKAVGYLLKAGDKARRAYLNDEAIHYFQRALERLNALESQIPDPQSQMAARLDALKGLGQVYQGIGRVSEAEECFRQAIALGREMGLPARELAQLYWWLGEALWWQGRFDEMTRLGEEGLALLGDDVESVEAALMNAVVSTGYFRTGDIEKAQEFASRNAEFTQYLPYSEELRPAYEQFLELYASDDKHVEEMMKWFHTVDHEPEPQRDLRASESGRERRTFMLVDKVKGFLSKQPKPFSLAVGLALIALVGVIDYVTGPEISFSIFYLLPISLVGWFVGRWAGVLVSFLSALVWFTAQVTMKPDYFHPAVPYWNAAVRLGFFLIVTYITSAWKAAAEEQEELIRFCAHDLSAPLTTVLLGLTTLRRVAGETLDETQKGLVDMATVSGNRMLTLINSLLDLSRLERGQIALQASEVNAQELVSSSLMQVAVWAGKNRVRTASQIDPSVSTVHADRSVTMRVLVNLLSNAIKLSNAESVITLRVAPYDTNMVAFSIADQGTGIPPEWVSKAFDVPQTPNPPAEARQASVAAGSGLGLTFCQLAVQAQGGRIWLENEVGKGTTVTFTLPATAQ